MAPVNDNLTAATNELDRKADQSWRDGDASIIGATTLLAPRDVARRLRLSTSRVVQLDREGVLRALRDSSGRRFYRADLVEAFARIREQGKA